MSGTIVCRSDDEEARSLLGALSHFSPAFVAVQSVSPPLTLVFVVLTSRQTLLFLSLRLAFLAVRTRRGRLGFGAFSLHTAHTPREYNRSETQQTTTTTMPRALAEFLESPCPLPVFCFLPAETPRRTTNTHTDLFIPIFFILLLSPSQTVSFRSFARLLALSFGSPPRATMLHAARATSCRQQTVPADAQAREGASVPVAVLLLDITIITNRREGSSRRQGRRLRADHHPGVSGRRRGERKGRQMFERRRVGRTDDPPECGWSLFTSMCT